MNMFKPTNAKTPEEYINMIDEPRRSEVQMLHEFIQKTVPDLAPRIVYGMIGYGSFHYKYASGRESDWSVVCLASQKNYISVYVSATDEKGYLAEQNKDRLGKVSVGKSCIRFKKIADVKLDELARVIKEGDELVKAGKMAV